MPRFMLNPFSKRLDAFEADIGPAGDVEFLAGDAGGSIGPTAGGVINVIGTAAQGISTSGAGNTITWTIADATETQKGVSELATNAEAIAGADTVRTIVPSSLSAKLGAQTINGLPYGAGTAAAITWTAAPTNGQILVGSTGVAPVLATLTAGEGITITNGAGTISIAIDGKFIVTGQTIGAVTADLYTLNLGATPGAYRFEANVVGYSPTTTASIGFSPEGVFETSGAAATLIGIVDDDEDQEAGAGLSAATFVASGNTVILRVTGLAGDTINWRATVEWIVAN